MPNRVLWLLVTASWFCAALSGCKLQQRGDATAGQPVAVPAHIAGTVAEYAVLLSGELPVRGFGVAVGLGTNGSAEVPPSLRDYFDQYLAKRNVGSYRHGTATVSPSRFLRDLDTAVVEVIGAIPPGAPKGSRFDVFVRTVPKTQTTSLEGGVVMPTSLAVSRGEMTNPDSVLNVWANSGGSLFVNPFADPGKEADTARMRYGRILGGGEVTRDRSILLQLRRSDYQRASVIQGRINARFPGLHRLDKVAAAKNPSIIELRVPQEYRDDYVHFLQLVMHLPIRAEESAWEVRAREIAKAIEQPGANHDELALIWEAMGRQVAPFVQPLYTSKNPSAAFYAARTGIRLGDLAAAEVLVRFAESANSPQQIPAIEELGRHRNVTRGITSLRTLIDDQNDMVRLAAYDALVKLGDRGLITRISIPKQFELDIVTSSREYVIYATRTEQPRIVLFGRDMPVSKPVFFCAPDDLVTVNARGDEKQMTVFRKIQRTGRYSDPFHVDFRASSLVETMGWLPEWDDEGNIKGLGLTYGQVVGVLYRMCKEGDIPAKFVLQQQPDVRKIYEDAVAAGRPDTMEE